MQDRCKSNPKLQLNYNNTYSLQKEKQPKNFSQENHPLQILGENLAQNQIRYT